MDFSINLRWTAYVDPKSPRGPKNESGCFLSKEWTFLEESLLHNFLCENFQRQSCKVFSGLCTNGWWGTSPTT